MHLTTWPLLCSVTAVVCYPFSDHSPQKSTEPTAPLLFHMNFVMAGSRLQRREIQYITPDGYLTPDATAASPFYIQDSMLYSSGQVVSAYSTDAYIPFSAQSPVADTTQTWTIIDGIPTWQNQSWADCQASLCQGTDNRIYLVFQAGPPDCTPVSANVIFPQDVVSSSTAMSVPSSTFDSSSQVGTTSLGSTTAMMTSLAASSFSETLSSTIVSSPIPLSSSIGSAPTSSTVAPLPSVTIPSLSSFTVIPPTIVPTLSSITFSLPSSTLSVPVMLTTPTITPNLPTITMISSSIISTTAIASQTTGGINIIIGGASVSASTGPSQAAIPTVSVPGGTLPGTPNLPTMV